MFFFGLRLSAIKQRVHYLVHLNSSEAKGGVSYTVFDTELYFKEVERLVFP